MKTALFTQNFWLIAIASTAFFASMHMLTPSIPLYLEAHANALWSDMGVILAAFITASLVMRPWVGQLCDKYGPRPWMILGAVLFSVMPLVYPMTLASPWFLAVRILHGMGLGCFMTASTAFLSLEIPADRRGEGMSHYSNAIKLAMAFGPYLGLYFAHHQWFVSLFYLSSGFALLTLALMFFLSAPKAEKTIEHPEKPAGKTPLIQKDALFPGLVMTSNSIVFGTLIPFTPLIAQEKGFGSATDGFYVIYAFSLIFSRALTGPISDKYGRSRVIVPGMLGVCITLLLLTLALHPTFFLVSAGLYGLCAGTVQPSLMAMVADRVPATQRGAGMATFTLLTDLGIALGTFITGHFGPLYGYCTVLYGIITITALGLTGFILYPKLSGQTGEGPRYA